MFIVICIHNDLLLIHETEEEFEDITAERIWDVFDRSFIEPVVTHPKSFTCTFPLRGSRASAVTSHLLWRPGFNPRLFHKRFVVDKNNSGTSFSPSTSVYACQYPSTSAPYISFIYHQCCILLTTISVIEKKTPLSLSLALSNSLSLHKFYTLLPPTYKVQDINYLWIGKQDCQESESVEVHHNNRTHHQPTTPRLQCLMVLYIQERNEVEN